MKKKLNVLFGLIISFLMIIIPISVSAYDGNSYITVEASQSDGKVQVHGRVTDGMEVPTLAIVVAVYKENGTDLVTMETTQTKIIGEVPTTGDYSDDFMLKVREYSASMNLPEGTYLIRVADYNGGPFVETKVTVSKENEETPEKEITPEEQQGETSTSENPITSDNIMKAVAIFAISLLGILVVIMINKKFKKQKAVK
ncbi:MAG: hypothetical protein IJG00_01165 [Clostridia bacterium]|nr:hypothetical protein [Clostridia bacterium]